MNETSGYTILRKDVFDLLQNGTINYKQWSLQTYLSTFPGRGKRASVEFLAEIGKVQKEEIVEDLTILDKLGLLGDDIKRYLDGYPVMK